MVIYAKEKLKTQDAILVGNRPRLGAKKNLNGEYATVIKGEGGKDEAQIGGGEEREALASHTRLVGEKDHVCRCRSKRGGTLLETQLQFARGFDRTIVKRVTTFDHKSGGTRNM